MLRFHNDVIIAIFHQLDYKQYFILMLYIVMMLKLKYDEVLNSDYTMYVNSINYLLC